MPQLLPEHSRNCSKARYMETSEARPSRVMVYVANVPRVVSLVPDMF